MTILHVCGVENKLYYGSTIAILDHVNEQAKLGRDKIMVCHVRGIQMDWGEGVQEIAYADFEANLSRVDLVVFQEVYYRQFFGMAKKLVKRGIPYVILPHCSLTQGAQNQLKAAKMIVNAIWGNRFIHHAATIHYLSASERDESAGWTKA